MAEYDVARGNIAEHDKTLTINAADTVTFPDDIEYVEVLSRGQGDLYVSTDGDPATLSGGNCYLIPGGAIISRTMPCSGRVVSLFSAAAVKYSVTHVDGPDS